MPTLAPSWPGWLVLAASPAFSALKALLFNAEGAASGVRTNLHFSPREICSSSLWPSRRARWRRGGWEGRRRQGERGRVS